MRDVMEIATEVMKTAEVGQRVSSTPIDPQSDEAIFEHGWYDLNYFGMPGGFRGNAVGLALAIQCADVKARDLSKAEMLLWKRTGRGWTMVEPTAQGAAGDLAYHLMSKPNETNMTWTELWRMVALHYELAQNAYIYTPRDLAGKILEFIPVMPGHCRMRVSASGRIFYEIVAVTEFDRAILGETYMIVPEEDVLHYRGRLLDGINGLSNIALGSPQFELFTAINEYQTKLFGNDGKQPLVFQTKDSFGGGDVGNAAFNRLKNQLRDRVSKSYNSGDPILLENGLEAKVIALSSKDAVTSESFTQQVMRICGLMQTPPHKIFALEAVAYNNMAAMDRQYANDCLLPTAINFETKLRNHALPERVWPLFAPEFDRNRITVTDPDTLEKLIKTGMSTGVMTVNEARELMPFRLNPLGESGDVRTVPVNMAVFDLEGNVVHAATGQNPTNPGAGEGESADNNAGKKHLRLIEGAK